MHTWKQNSVLLLLVVAAVLFGWIVLTLAVPRAAADPQAVDLTWNVVANGGATMSSASYTLLSTSGQPAAGEIAGSSYSLISGYWADLRTFLQEIFLPTVRRP
jgi:hypothetical protein